MKKRSPMPRLCLARLNLTESKQLQKLKKPIKREWLPTNSLLTPSLKNLSTLSTKDLKLISRKLPTILLALLNLSLDSWEIRKMLKTSMFNFTSKILKSSNLNLSILMLAHSNPRTCSSMDPDLPKLKYSKVTSLAWMLSKSGGHYSSSTLTWFLESVKPIRKSQSTRKKS